MLANLSKADLNDAAAVKKAIQGAYAVFAVTNYWESHSADVEMKQGRNMADAAKVRISHFLFHGMRIDQVYRKLESNISSGAV